MRKIFTRIAVLLLALTFSFTCENTFAQGKCGTTEAMEELIKQDPSILQKQQEMEIAIQEAISSRRPGVESAEPVYIIPVVFHVLHMYGTENISDEQIQDAMNIINRDFRKLNPDTSAIIPLFKPIAADCEIEFRLATKDPEGDCTNGIDRIYTHKTISADDGSKLNQWDPHKYLNIWIVRSIGNVGVAGYAYYPAAVNGVHLKKDGIIILHNHIGSIGTGSINNSRSLTHEIGHYLNLAHTWGSTNQPNVACGDDFVGDTPETKGSAVGVCNLNLSTCDTPVIENVQNFMDYSYCSKMYTEGQKTRMRTTLNLPIAARNSLWNPSNLIATGTDAPPIQACVPEADFYANRAFICEGAGVGFFGGSSKADVVNWEWDLPGGTPSTSTSRNVATFYSNPGWKTVSLKVANASGNSTTTRNNFIYVSPPNADFQGNYSDGFENPAQLNTHWFPVNVGRNISQWNFTQLSSSQGNRAMSLNAFSPPTTIYYQNPPIVVDPGIGANDIDGLISPALDFTYLSSASLNFRLAYATAAFTTSDITESLKVYYSLTCGQTWIPIYTKQGINLTTAGHLSTAYVPSQATDWRLETVNLPPALNNKANVRFMFEYTSGAYSNNIYIDDFTITGTVGLEENFAGSVSLNVFPNPATGSTSISYYLDNKQNIAIEITDMLGNRIINLVNENQEAGEKMISLPIAGLESGIYFVRLVSDSKYTTSKKLIIVN